MCCQQYFTNVENLYRISIYLYLYNGIHENGSKRGLFWLEIWSEPEVPDLSQNVEQVVSSSWSSTRVSFGRQEEAVDIPQQRKDKREEQDEVYWGARGL